MNRQWLAMALITAVIGLLAACGGEEQPVPTAVPETTAKPVPNIEPQTQALMLRLTSPEVNLVTSLDRISVTGVTSPDATLSVNGRLALPDPEGRFSISFDLLGAGNPLLIEVITTAITGETESLVRPVIFLDDSRGSGRSGVFGTVESVTPSKITLETGSGPVTLSIDDGTAVAIHGWKSPSVSNITSGALVAIMADGPRALSVLAVLGRPARTRHFTGIVAASAPTGSVGAGSSDVRNITLWDDSGRQITAIAAETLTDALNGAPVGEVVTAVLEQDLSTGSLTVTAIDRALASAERLYEALALNQKIDSPQATANITNLRWRLAEHGVRNLSILVNNQPYEGWREAIAGADGAYTRLFSEHHIGAPSADVTGLVTAIENAMGGSGTRQVTIQPASGQAVMVKISDATPVALFGERIRSGQLDLASRITVRYAISGNDANRVTVMAGNTLSDDASAKLAARAGLGEVQGTLMDVRATAALITILDPATGQPVTLQTGGQSAGRFPGAAVYRDGNPVDLDPSMEGSNVFARFDPASHRLLELESLKPLSGEELVSGVVHSFIPKFADGNLTIRTTDGRLRSFTHNAGTSIRRDGLRVSIQDVRLGDLVRPNTRVRLSDGTGGQAREIVVLSLKAPQPGLTTGVIRGLTGGFGGQVRVTVSNIWLDMISLKVTSQTAITQLGRTLGAQDLKVGQNVALASYDLVTLEAGILVVDPPRESTRASIATGNR